MKHGAENQRQQQQQQDQPKLHKRIKILIAQKMQIIQEKLRLMNKRTHDHRLHARKSIGGK